MVVSLARKMLLHDKLRFVITVAGVAFAVILVFVQIGLFLGLLEYATVTIRQIDADLWVTSRNTLNIDFPSTFSETYVQRVRAVPGVARADNLIVWWLFMALPTGATEMVEVYGLEDFEHWRIPWDFESANPVDMRCGPYIFVDKSGERRLGPFEVGEYRELNGHRMKIIGKTHGAVSFTTTPIIFMDSHRVQDLISPLLTGKTTYIIVKLVPDANPQAVKAAIAKQLRYNDVLTSAEWAKKSRNYWISTTGLGLNMYLTAFLGVLIGVVVVAQTLYTMTMDHLKEFGTIKAIGGGNADIYRILLQQAAIAAVTGFVIGLIPALVMRPFVADAGLTLKLSWDFGLWVFVGTFGFCLGAAMISFRKVANIDPALVFRS